MLSHGGIVIGEDAWSGVGVMVLDGARKGAGAVVRGGPWSGWQRLTGLLRLAPGHGS